MELRFDMNGMYTQQGMVYVFSFVCFVLYFPTFYCAMLITMEATAAIPAKAAAAQESEFIEAPLSVESSPDPQYRGVTTSTNIVATAMTVVIRLTK